jgi:hypothetical protein
MEIIADAAGQHVACSGTAHGDDGAALGDVGHVGVLAGEGLAQSVDQALAARIGADHPPLVGAEPEDADVARLRDGVGDDWQIDAGRVLHCGREGAVIGIAADVDDGAVRAFSQRDPGAVALLVGESVEAEMGQGAAALIGFNH